MSTAKCLATFLALITLPTARAMASLPRSGRRARRVAAAILASSAPGGCQQLAALAGPLGRQERVVAGDQPLTGVIRGGDLGHVGLVEQGGLDGVLSHQRLDRR